MTDMRRYDPMQAPDPEDWLALDEQERISFALGYHRRPEVKLPNAQVHAVIHAVVETQIAMGDEIPVSRTVERLQEEGLDRHDAIHAVGSVLIKHMHALMNKNTLDGDPNQAYWSELARLTAKKWKRSH